ncbi:Protein kinase domain [Trypanosoma vivax]|uniref:Protein kinase domain-containing protein n=1 Tax=Trypanosoma vivax (strain Y486) TaxID=1055687 RepID=G0U2S3_TRYVY|nr:putative protein kinase [Trypanosoma vivax]KAH8604152.1 Protein kinase domain [Trypanosoma vivax]CCC50577.1 putative protein kinase [Trypanosoma vivax Y486]
MQRYKILGKKGEGTFSEVLKVQEISTKRHMAIKCMKKRFDSKDQVNRLREIQAVRRLQPHPNIVSLIEVMYDKSTGRLALVMELMDMNLYELIRGQQQLNEDCVMSFMYQLLKALDHAHRGGVFHRDVKPENLLVNADGTLKIADFGSCRGINVKPPLTEYVSTRWYRAPECLLTNGYYTYKMDLWSAGCVFFEMMALCPLFPGSNEIDQLHKIHYVLGTPTPETRNRIAKHCNYSSAHFPERRGVGLEPLLPGAPRDALDLLGRLLTYNDRERPTAKEALRHPYFKKLREKEKAGRQQIEENRREDVNTSVEALLPVLGTPASSMMERVSQRNHQNYTEEGGQHVGSLENYARSVSLPKL